MEPLKRLWRFSLEHRIVHFLLAGTFCTGLNIGILFALTEGAGLWYLYSEIFAFSISYAVNFLLQRYVTFVHEAPGSALKQISLHLPFQLANLATDEMLLYLLVAYMGLWYPLAQLCTSAALAAISFFATRHIFSPKACAT